MSNDNTPTYLRASNDASGGMYGDGDLEESSGRYFLHEDGSVDFHQLKHDGLTPRVKPAATGKIRRNTVTTENAPDLVGSLRTAKGSRFSLSLWYHGDDPEDAYYVLRYAVVEKRAGKVFTPECFE